MPPHAIRTRSGPASADTPRPCPLPMLPFSLVLASLSLIDIEDYSLAIAEMARVLAPGGSLLMANLPPLPRHRDPASLARGSGQLASGGRRRAAVLRNRRCGSIRANWMAWSGLHRRNHHCPLLAFVAAFPGEGLTLRVCDTPPYHGADDQVAQTCARIPWFNLMVWAGPASPPSRGMPFQGPLQLRNWDIRPPDRRGSENGRADGYGAPCLRGTAERNQGECACFGHIRPCLSSCPLCPAPLKASGRKRG